MWHARCFTDDRAWVPQSTSANPYRFVVSVLHVSTAVWRNPYRASAHERKPLSDCGVHALRQPGTLAELLSVCAFCAWPISAPPRFQSAACGMAVVHWGPHVGPMAHKREPLSVCGICALRWPGARVLIECLEEGRPGAHIRTHTLTHISGEAS